MISLEIDLDQAEIVARDYLIDLLDMLEQVGDDPATADAINRVIAYMSVPGTWKEGAYDKIEIVDIDIDIDYDYADDTYPTTYSVEDIGAIYIDEEITL